MYLGANAPENAMQRICIIPARYHSSRFPGKPLAKIGNKPMIQLVYERVSAQAVFDRIIVATEDERICEVLDTLNIPHCLTADHHPSGTDRCAEVVDKMELHNDLIINVQGDEPFLPDGLLSELLTFVRKTSFPVSSICTPMDANDVSNPNICKVVLTRGKRAMYFSRAPIPWIRDHRKQPDKSIFFRHIGVYAFRPGVILELYKLKPTRLEQAEKLEQLRWLEHDIEIGLMKTKQHFPPGIDTPWDLQFAEQMMKGGHS